VLVTDTSPRPAQAQTSVVDKALQAGIIQTTNLGGARKMPASNTGSRHEHVSRN
jgi:hypothetical protein